MSSPDAGPGPGDHPGVESACRAFSTAYAKAIRRPLPATIQARTGATCGATSPGPSARGAAHTACWVRGPAYHRERWRQVRDLLDKGVGLLKCARQLNVGLNTVKRYVRKCEPDRGTRNGEPGSRTPASARTAIGGMRTSHSSRRVAAGREPQRAIAALTRIGSSTCPCRASSAGSDT
ncbi:helix-turn-helix domain-containing protein [Plantactinospora mayteni]|uniref:helix-turn-helix domain-containing protein n=1 Tax=Plantactinospora mayteni TaxID=566021 RepID=UPI001EF4ECDC|nr:helix-turn-helix domain-containing protein [Plantactinospora mayteni]